MTLLYLFLLYSFVLTVALFRAGHRARPGAADPTRPERPNRLLIVGATGGTGRELVGQALERGYVVTALARSPSRLAIEHPNLSVIQGDVLDPSSLDLAVQGHEAVLCALGHKRYLGPSRILSRGTENLLRAMEAHGVRRIVCETSLGVGDSAGRMGLYYTFFVVPVVLPFYYWDKARQERAIAASGVEWVIVRPGALTNGAKRGSIRHGAGIGSFLWTVSVSRADVAAFMLDQLESNENLRAAPGLRA